MRIAFMAQPFDTMYPPVRGGSLSLWVYYMAGLCAKRGHQTVVFGNHGGFFSPKYDSSDNVNYVFTRTGVDRLINKTASVAHPVLTEKSRLGVAVPQFASKWHHRGFAGEVGRTARLLRSDVVHIMNYSQFVPVVRKLHRQAKIVLHMQCEWLTQIDSEIITPRLEQADLIVGCSEYITRKIAGAYPDYAKRCVTVPNAADTVPGDSSKSPAEVGKTILFVGRLSPEKGVHHLIQAFHLVLQRFPDAHLRLVGGAGSMPLELLVGLSNEPHVTALRTFYQNTENGGKDPYLVALEQEAGEELGKRIIFEGRINHDRIEECYRQCSVLVNPSLSESFGISLVEAMMRRIPVVATKIGGMTYTVDHGITGLLVEPANPAQLAGAICEILGDRERGRLMGEAGRIKAVQRFSWDRTADLLLDHMSAVV